MDQNSPGELLAYLNGFSLRSFLGRYVFYTNTTPEEELEFKAYARENTLQMVQPIAVFLAVFAVVFWPTDYFVLAGRDDVFWTFVTWRSLLVLDAIVLVVGLNVFEILREYVHLFLVVVICMTTLGVSYAFGSVGGLQAPWFWFIFLVPWITIFLALDPLKRLLATSCVILSWISGYLVPFPGHLEYTFIGVPLVFSFAMIFIVSFAGHVLYHFFRKDFFNQKKLQYLARHDRLTGLLNRRHFDRRLEEEFERSTRYGNSLSILMIDLDHFKEVNDNYGHQAGDRVLETIGEIIRSETREPDVAGRYGGEEFVVLLTETGLDDAIKSADRLREELKSRTFSTDDGGDFSITCSIGVANRTDTMHQPEDLLKQADQALYEAKQTGRDRVSTG